MERDFFIALFFFFFFSGMINLSDEETSNHVDSDVVFKSSTAATSPQGMFTIFQSIVCLPKFLNICLLSVC